MVAATEQFRDLYVFLAPQDYDVNFVNIIRVDDAAVTLDDEPVDEADFSTIGSGASVAPKQLASTGAHHLSASKPVGLQVYGYGRYTGYQYPGGPNLKAIAPPPPK